MPYTKYLRWIILALLSLAFLIPFIVADGSFIPNMFFPFITGKNFAFRILVELLAGFYVLLALREPKYRPHASILMWVLLGFVVWMGIATAASVDPIKSFWSNFERMEGYLSILHLFAYCVIAGAVVSAEEWWDKLFQISIAASVLEGFIALFQIIHLFGFAPSSQSGARADGTFGNATYLAVYMLINLFLTLFVLVRMRRPHILQGYYGIALILQGVAVYYTETRGTLLGLLLGLVVVAVWIAWKAREVEWHTLRRISLGALITIAILVVGFLGLSGTALVQHSPTLTRLASISLNDPTVRTRLLYIWPMALEGFKDKPILGWGQENFNFVFNKYYVPAMYDQEQWFDRAHNAFLDWLIAGGLPAFLLYLSLFVFAIWAVVRSRLSVPEQAALLGLLCAYAFNNLFVFDNLVSYIYFFIIIAFAHGLSPRKPHALLLLSRPASEHIMAIAAPIVLVLMGIGIWVVNVPGIARAEGLIVALTTQNLTATATAAQGSPKDPANNLAEFNQILSSPGWPGTPLGRQEVVEQMLQFASNTISPSTSVSPNLKQQFYTASLNAATAFLATRPHDARLELFVGTFLNAFGQAQAAQQYLLMAHNDSPQKQTILFPLGITEISTGNTAQGIAYLQQAFNGDPAYTQARIFYAAGLYYTGGKAQADALLMEGFGTVLVNDSTLLQVYIDTKQYDRVVGIWQIRVQQDPSNSQTHIGLAAAYFAQGNKAQAIAELQRAAQLDPNLAPQIDSIITQIQNGTLK